jgi:pyruvate/2-oxoglutarate dehydrogenase complex dihydrolipoamide acyltransferase (E2) component
MFYAREGPGRPPYVRAGDHFQAGDPLYIIEVMKMFNKVQAPFSGTLVEVLVENDGHIVTKGQPLFRVVPDEKVTLVDPGEVQRGRHQRTRDILALCQPTARFV